MKMLHVKYRQFSSGPDNYQPNRNGASNSGGHYAEQTFHPLEV